MASSTTRTRQITTAISSYDTVGESAKNLGAPAGLSVICEMTGGTGGTSVTGLIQTTFDGVKWFDIGCFTFATTPSAKVLNLRADTAVLTPATLGTDAMTTDGGINGVIGSEVRFKVKSVGTYSNTAINFSYAVAY